MRRSTVAALGAATTVGICAAGTFFAGPAFAYPPGTKLAVSATAVGHPNHHQQFAVLVTNGKPGCRVAIFGGDRPVFARIGTDGTAWATVGAEYHGGKAKIVAETMRCQSKEKASTKVVLTKGAVHGPAKAKRGKPVNLTLTHWAPSRRVSVIATNGRTVEKFSVWPNRHGVAGLRFVPKGKGTWAVVARQDGASAHITIKVS